MMFPSGITLMVAGFVFNNLAISILGICFIATGLLQ